MKSNLLLKLIILGTIFFIISASFIHALPVNKENNTHFFQFNSFSLRESDQNITDLMDQLYMISLSTGIILNNTLVWNQGYGICKSYYNSQIPNESKIPTKDTLYVSASVSKPVTATAILQLYDAGKLDITDNVNEYLDFDLKSPFYP